MKHLPGLYRIQNAVNDHYYIGSSKNLYNRWHRGHLPNLKCGTHANEHLQNAFNKYGPSAFTFNVLMYCDENVLHEFEQKLLDRYVGLDECYNIGPFASSGTRGRPMTEAAKENLRRINTGKRYGKATKEKCRDSHLGMIFSDEHKRKLSELHIGKSKSASHIASIKRARKAQIGKKGKFSSQDAQEIRRLYKTGQYARYQLAKQFETTRQYIGKIVNFKVWPV